MTKFSLNKIDLSFLDQSPINSLSQSLYYDHDKILVSRLYSCFLHLFNFQIVQFIIQIIGMHFNEFTWSNSAIWKIIGVRVSLNCILLAGSISSVKSLVSKEGCSGLLAIMGYVSLFISYLVVISIHFLVGLYIQRMFDVLQSNNGSVHWMIHLNDVLVAMMWGFACALFIRGQNDQEIDFSFYGEDFQLRNPECEYKKKIWFQNRISQFSSNSNSLLV